MEDRSFLMALLLYWRGKDRESLFNLFAPFYYDFQSEQDKVRVLLPIHFYRQTGDKSLFILGPYFSKRSISEQTKFIFPLFFKNEDEKLKSKLIFPFYWSFQSLTEEKKLHELLFPFYLRVKGEKDQDIYSPVFWSYKDLKTSKGILPPFYWKLTESSKTQIGFPLYWRFFKKDPELKELEIAFPWIYLRSGNNSFRTFAPLYWGRTKEEKGEWNLFFPLLFQSEDKKGNNKCITPIFSRFKDENGRIWGHTGLNFFLREPWGGKSEIFFPFLYYRGEPDFFKLRCLSFYLEHHHDQKHFETSLLPLLRYRRDSDRRQIFVLAFYRDKDPEVQRGFFLNYFWRKETALEKNSPGLQKHILFPIFWSVRSEDQKTTILPPLFALHEKEDFKFSLLTPLIFQIKKGGETFTTFFPAYMKRAVPERSWTTHFFLFWRHQKGKEAIAGLFPIYRRASFPNGSSLLLPGFYYLKEGKETQGFVLPYFWDKRGPTQYQFLPPFYCQFSRPTWGFKSLFPIYKFENQEIKETGIFPFWARTKSKGPEHFLANSHRFLPFYFYRKLRHGTDLWMPFLLARFEKEIIEENQKTIRGRLFLISYWERSAKSSLTRLDPLFSFYRTPASKGFAMPTAPFPLWKYEVKGAKKEEQIVEGTFFPYFWKRSPHLRKNLFFPVYYSKKKISEESLKEVSQVQWFLAYFSSSDELEQKRKTFFFPFYWYFAEKGKSIRVLIPYLREREPQMTRDIFFPVWWRSQKKESKTSVFFPIFYKAYQADLKEKTIFFPGFWVRKSPESSSLLFLNFLQKSSYKTQEKSTFFFPLYWQESEPKKNSAYLFPLYFKYTKEHFHSKIFFPLYWKFEGVDTSIQIVPPYFKVYSKQDEESTTGFAPLWTYSHNRLKTAKSFQLLGGLMGIEKKEGKTKFTLFYFLKI